MPNLTPDQREPYTDAQLREDVEHCAMWALSEGGLNSRAEVADIMAALDALIQRANEA